VHGGNAQLRHGTGVAGEMPRDHRERRMRIRRARPVQNRLQHADTPIPGRVTVERQRDAAPPGRPWGSYVFAIKLGAVRAFSQA
jgi:hypothetical protein